ncbi:14-3-3 protein [Aphanomyces cochlioides]|nr:14-3-3 protein [Aphanomyces cochlioides]
MKNIATDNKQELSMEENNLLLVAYKNEVGPRRASWRILRSIEEKSTDKSNVAAIRSYRGKIHLEIQDICADVVATTDDFLLPNATSTESLTFYHKMKADYYRYWAEINSGEEAQAKAKLAQACYDTAWTLATTDLSAASRPCAQLFRLLLRHPRQHGQSRAFDDAIADLDTLSEECYRDTTLIMQLLHDNISLWVASTEDDDTPQ